IEVPPLDAAALGLELAEPAEQCRDLAALTPEQRRLHGLQLVPRLRARDPAGGAFEVRSPPRVVGRLAQLREAFRDLGLEGAELRVVPALREDAGLDLLDLRAHGITPLPSSPPP